MDVVELLNPNQSNLRPGERSLNLLNFLALKIRIFIYETIHLKACTGGRVRFAKDVVEDPDSEEPEKEEFANRMWNRNENCSCGCEDCEAKGKPFG